MEDNVHAQRFAENTSVHLMDIKYASYLLGDVLNDTYGIIRIVEKVALDKFDVPKFFEEFERKKDASIAYKLKKIYYNAKHDKANICQFDSIEVSDRVLNNLGLCLMYLEKAMLLKHNVRESTYIILKGENEDFAERYIYILEKLMEYGFYDLADELIVIGENKINSAKMFYNCSVIQYNVGKLDAALEYIEKALDKEKNAEYYYYRGELLFLKGEYCAAENSYLKGIKVNDSVWYYYSRLSGLYSTVGKFDLAIECMKKAIEINPIVPDNYSILGGYLECAGRYIEACSVYRKEITLLKEGVL